MKHPVDPMLAMPSPTPDIARDEWPRMFDQDGWLYEPKLDGIRAIVSRNASGRVTIQSRQFNDITGQFPEIVAAAGTHRDSFVMDGEIVMLGNAGVSSFHALQNHRTGDRSRLQFVAFDLLETDGTDITRRPLRDRREELARYYMPERHMATIRSYTDGRLLWKLAVEERWEGIIAKPERSIYLPGSRVSWLKLKRNVRDDFAVIGFTEGTGHRSGTIGALVLGQQRGGSLVYAGKCGTGFDRTTLAQLLPELLSRKQPIPSVEPAQATRVKLHLDGKAITWTKPDLTVRVEFNDYAGPERVVRMGSYKGVVQ